MPSKPRILFIDDEPQVLAGLRRGMLRHADRWDMTFLSDPAAALEAMRDQPFDVVVSDMKMPGMTGIELVVAMRRVAPDAAYIMLTGTADLRTAIDAINRADMFRFFTKPCPAFLLAEGIAEALAARRLPGQLQPSMGEAALDRLPVGVIVVDARAHVRFMNRRGAALCAAEDGLRLAGGRQCQAAAAAESAALHRAVADALANGGTSALSITRPSLKRPLSVLVSMLPGPDSPSAALYIGDPDDLPLVPPEQLAQLLDLTPAEARIAHSLALGHSLDEAAGLSEVTVSTARTYLKQIFVKTGTARQAELVKLVLGLPAVEA